MSITLRSVTDLHFFKQQRIHNIIAEIFWNPVSWPFAKSPSHKAAEHEKEPTAKPVQRFDSRKRTGAPPQPFPPSQRTPQLLRIDEDETSFEPQPTEESQTQKEATIGSEEATNGSEEVAGQENGPISDDEIEGKQMHLGGDFGHQKEQDFDPASGPMEERDADCLSEQSAWHGSSFQPLVFFGRSESRADAEAERLSKNLWASRFPSHTIQERKSQPSGSAEVDDQPSAAKSSFRSLAFLRRR